jgi:small subunit ribosomal protein S2
MKKFVFGSRGGIHIVDLQKTALAAQDAAAYVKKIASEGKQMIFVGTKKQAVESVKEAAQKCGQFYVVKRWLGGMLTNFVTIKASIDRLRKFDIARQNGDWKYYNKKEAAKLEKEYNLLLEYLEGIRDMKEPPGAMFVVDLRKEHIAIREARILGIPVIGIADTNTDPEDVDYPIPGNDDAIRSIKLFINLMAEAYSEGAKEYELTRRAESDKKMDAPEVSEKQEAEPRRRPSRSEGEKPRRDTPRTEKPQREAAPQPAKEPSVFRMSKRKLVAAGTADDLEIKMELEQAVDEVETEKEKETTPSEKE